MDIIFTSDFDFFDDDTFYDIDPMSLPTDAHYYFNVLIKSVALRTGDMELPQLKNIDNLWYIEHITDARPWIAHFYIDDFVAEDKMIEYPHCVVEIRDNGEISWYNMIDWETEDRWTLWDEDDFEEDEDDSN